LFEPWLLQYRVAIGQVVHTYVPLLTNSIPAYQQKLGRRKLGCKQTHQGVWLSVMEAEISAALWTNVDWEGLYVLYNCQQSAFGVLHVNICSSIAASLLLVSVEISSLSTNTQRTRSSTTSDFSQAPSYDHRNSSSQLHVHCSSCCYCLQLNISCQ